jgi:7-keto-8-aminopelargonate synthetase-like enzyme
VADLTAVELRLRAILDPYRDRLEEGEIYGVPTLRRRGAKAHDWFAGVQPVSGAVKFNFLQMHAHPALLAGISPALRKRKTGASVFKFTDLDEALFRELEGLVARAYDVYMAAGAAAGGT